MITKKFVRISPYLYTLSLIGLIGMMACNCLLFSFLIPTLKNLNIETIVAEWWLFFLLWIGINFAYILACLMDSYVFWGSCAVDGTGIIVKAPLRKTIRMYCNEIKCIGIDYGIINGRKQFWIYASSIEIPPQYIGKIIKMPISSTTVRIQYSPDVFKAFYDAFPPALRKELKKGESVLRIYNN